ncbi:MAG: phosphotransferase [Porticoccaceae bacterium]|nr:phosphotransferase [Porticoccaceae bacterium]
MTASDNHREQAILQDWLRVKMPSSDDLTVTALSDAKGGGWSARIIFVTIAYSEAGHQREDRLVVRFLPDYLLFLGTDLEVQWRFCEALRQHSSIPAPAILGVENDPAVLGQPFYVMERVSGEVASQSPNYNLEGWITELPVPQRTELWRNALTTLAELHRLDWRQGFEFLNQPEYGEPGLDQLLNWLVAWRDWAAKGRKLPVVDATIDYLLREKPAQSGVSVLWGDPTPSNVLWGKDLKVNGIIDFESVTLGPPEADLGWWLYMNNLLSEGYRIKRLEGLPSAKESIEMYEQALGRKVEHMDYYDILAAVRMAIITVRSVDLHISLGHIAADNNSITHNPVTVYLANKLNLPVPEIGEDFHTFTANIFPMGDDD